MKLVKKIVTIGLSILMAGSMIACGGKEDVEGNKNVAGATVEFMYGGSAADMTMYQMMLKEFNNTVGKEKGITVTGIPKGSNLDNVLIQQLSGRSGADVVAVSDRMFKRYTPYLLDLSDSIGKEILDKFYSDVNLRYRYDAKDATSYEDDPLYGVPAYNDTTVLFYNKTALAANGVICISVNEDNMDDFNAGGKDANGKTKADYGIPSNVTIPKKGFYRSKTPYTHVDGVNDGRNWKPIAGGEIAVFNDKIAMNWDEIEDLSMICTSSKNPKSVTKYGYYTEWWFNYGWSVGGDCLEDMSGNGDWTYAHATNFANYQVQKGKTYTGAYSGIEYAEGDFLELRDLIAANPGEKIGYSTEGGTTFYYTANGKKVGARDLSSEVAKGILVEFPSIREAFSRFVYLAGVGGMNICPYPSEFSTTNSVSYFASGNVAMLVERVSYMPTIERIMTDEWGIAPLLQYKEYTEPTKPSCDTVLKKGSVATCSDGYALIINGKTDVKEAAIEFLKWYASEGQRVLAEKGYVSSRFDDAELMLEKLAYPNAEVVLQSVHDAKAGDWWYMPDKDWIDHWATPLNSKVRYGQMTLEEYLYQYIDVTNRALMQY